MARFLRAAALILLLCPGVAKGVDLPWQVNTPIVTVQKSLYLEHPRAGAGAWVDMSYVGPGMELLETQSRLLKDFGSTMLQYSATEGYLPFRESLPSSSFPKSPVRNHPSTESTSLVAASSL